MTEYIQNHSFFFGHSEITEYIQFSGLYVIIFEVFSGLKAEKKRFSYRSYE